MRIAGIEANAHLTINKTIDSNGISKSVMTTGIVRGDGVCFCFCFCFCSSLMELSHLIENNHPADASHREA